MSPTSAPAAWILLLFALLAPAAGCRPGRPPESSWTLRRPEAFPRDFLLRQRLVFRMGEVEESLETALQRRGDGLTLIGLTPFGTRAFVLQQRGLDVSFESHLPEGELPFPPRLILDDVQRTLLPLLSRQPLADGEHRGRMDGDEVVEIWRHGRLIQRSFRGISREGPEEITIAYGDEGYGFDEPPNRIEIHNGRRGYELVLETLAYQRL